MLNKIILEKNIPEDNVAEKYIELRKKTKSMIINKNQILN